KISRPHPFCDIFIDARIAPGKNPNAIRQEIAAAINKINLDCEVTLFQYSRGFIAQHAEPLIEAVTAAHRYVFGAAPPAPPSAEMSMWRDLNVFNEVGIPSICYAPPARAAERRRQPRHEDRRSRAGDQSLRAHRARAVRCGGGDMKKSGWRALWFLTLFSSSSAGAAVVLAEPLRVGIPGLSAEFAPVWAANDRGFLKKHGFETEVIAMQGGTQLAQAIIAGSIPIAVMGGAYLTAAVRGADLVMIATHMDKLPYS